MFKKIKNKKGFTLTELIVVIVIIGILAAVLIPSLTGYITKAKKSADEQKVASLNTLLIEAQLDEVKFNDTLELKEYLENEMDYDGDYSLKVEGSYMWYDSKKKKINIITETDEPTLKKLSDTDTPKFVSEGKLKSPEGLMQYSSGEEVWLIGGNGYLFDLVEEIRNIGNSGELNEYNKLTNENVKKVLKKFFEEYIFSGTKGTYSVNENGEVSIVASSSEKKVVEANSKNSLAELFHNEVVKAKIKDINKTLSDEKAPVELVLDGYTVTVKITESGLSKAAPAVLQMINLLTENGCKVGYIIPKKYDSIVVYEEVLNKIIEGYNSYDTNKQNNTITSELYEFISIEDDEKIEFEDIEEFYKVDLSEEAVFACLDAVRLALCLIENNVSENTIYDLKDPTLRVDLFKGKDPIRLIGVFESGKYRGLEAQYDFVFQVSDEVN